MNLAKMSTNGQITVPMEVRHELQLKAGDKILFIRNKNGEVIMQSLHKATVSVLGTDTPKTGTAM